MSTTSLQLSHAELLLTLALLDLPAPPALGPRPVAGCSPDALAVSLAAAAAALDARGLLSASDSPDARPAPVAPLAALLRSVALAEGCLVVAGRHGPQQLGAHLSARGDCLVLHTAPLPGLHQLESLSGAAAHAWLAALVGDAPVAAPPPQLSVPAAALAATLDAIDADDDVAARGLLAGTGVDPAVAAAFVTAVGPRSTRLALGVARGLRRPVPRTRAALLLRGVAGVWWAPTAPNTTHLALAPLDARGLRHKLGALLADLTPCA